MEKRRPDDFRFLINAFSLTLVIFAIIATFQPYLEYETRLGEIKKVEQDIISLKPQDMPKMVVPKAGKPVMLVAYASWCYYCRQVMPVVVEALQNHELDNVTPVFLSFDLEPRRLSQYLVHNNYNTIVYPYVLAQILPGSISSSMKPSGSSFSGIIPYIGFFDKDGKIKAESVGIITKSKLLEMSQR